MDIAGITVHPDERWMKQIARNVTMEGCGALRDCRYLGTLVVVISNTAADITD